MSTNNTNNTNNTKNNANTDTDAAFITRVHDLPKELFDEIKEFVFTPSSLVCPVERGVYYPPAQLQVDHATRESFAAKWYGEKSFIVASEMHGDKTCQQWLASLTPQHQEQINNICLDGHLLRDGIENGTLLSLPDDAVTDCAVVDEHHARADAMLDMRDLVTYGEGEAQLFVKPEAFKMWVCRSLEEGREGIMMWAGTWCDALYALMT